MMRQLMGQLAESYDKRDYDKRRRGDVVAAARRVLKRFAADEHTYVEVTDAASPKSVITQSRRTGPIFSGISCRPCKN